MLSKETLQELSAILKTEYGQNLSPEEVLDAGQRLVGFFDKLAKLDFEDRHDDSEGAAPK